MTSDDFFGLASELKIQKSRVREVFTPHMPINSIDLFLGRQKEVQQIIEQINTPGQHSLLYGDRGVGKSSLANVASALLLKDIISGELYAKKCDSKETLTSIFFDPLVESGLDPDVIEHSISYEGGGKATAGVPYFSGEVNTKRSSTKKTAQRRLTPSVVASQISSLSGLFVIDEVDVIAEDSVRSDLAEVIKHLSDTASKFKILLVGIAETGTELTAKHPSVHRCLKETKLDRMSSEELMAIVTKGAKRVGIEFDPKVVTHIASVSAGYPHFAHLLALKCAESAVAKSKLRVSDTDLLTATAEATRDAEGTLKRIYDNAVRTAASTDLFQRILIAAAGLPGQEFTAHQLRARLTLMTGKPVTQGSLNNYLRRLVSNDGETILRRKAKGVYAFSDPRMPSYIRIANKKIFSVY